MVFPAYAGMFLRIGPLVGIGAGFPRIRGDVPSYICLSASSLAFSPHTRGCSGQAGKGHAGFAVFPAYAGMFRCSCIYPSRPLSFPRIRGDVPIQACRKRGKREFSPHTRGCSAVGVAEGGNEMVFPAYAGMFRPRNLPAL